MRSLRSKPLLAMVGVAFIVAAVEGSKPVYAEDPFIGQIQYFPYNFSPRGWSFCNGQLLPVAENTALFSLIGTTFGGDGRTTLGLPDMRGRVPIHPGTGPGLSSRRSGEKGGVETVSLNTNQMPAHSHKLMATNIVGDQSSPAGNSIARDGRDQTYRNEAPNTDMYSDSIGSTGGGLAHENMAPFLVLNCNIALTGVFPSRN